MKIVFEYEAEVDWLSNDERKHLVKELKTCVSSRNLDYLDVTRKHIALAGTIYDEDDFEDYLAIENTFDKFDVEWSGGAKEKEFDEPDWDSMPGGYDYEFSKSL